MKRYHLFPAAGLRRDHGGAVGEYTNASLKNPETHCGNKNTTAVYPFDKRLPEH